MFELLAFACGSSVLVALLYRKRLVRLLKAGIFQTFYYLYSHTRLGLIYYQHELKQNRKKLNGKPHSLVDVWARNGVTIQPIPISLDNYCYLITDEKDAVGVLIDPADPVTIQPVIDAQNITIIAVLTTHKHWDHSAGNEEWKKKYALVKVFGQDGKCVPGITNSVSDGERLSFGRLQFTVLSTPGHTSDHVVYVLDGTTFGAPSSIFSGDLMFVGGIGKLFEGTADAMLKSLDKLYSLPDDSLLWPGHEYSLNNLKFAASVEPQNVPVQTKLLEVEEKRRQCRCVIPSTMGDEKLYNPFLRTNDLSLLSALQTRETRNQRQPSAEWSTRVAALAECRARKDVFKPA